VEFPSRDIVAVAANAEQVTEQKNLNKWPHKIRRILRNEVESWWLRLCDIRGNGK
jgi:hypothetical protein